MEGDHVDLAKCADAAERLAGGGRTVVYLARGGMLWGLVAIADAPRSTSAGAVAALRERGVDVAMFVGDNRATAEHIGKELGLNLVLAEVLPGQTTRK